MNASTITAKTVGPALTFRKGLRDGLPICLGYLSVSFAFGMMAVEGGLPVWAAVLISMTNLTSSGQFAGTALIFAGGSYLEIGITTFVINIRYMLMSLSLSQKVDPNMSALSRSILSFGNTDEVFAVAMQQQGKIPSCYLWPDPDPLLRLDAGDFLRRRLYRDSSPFRPQRFGDRHLRDVHCYHHPSFPAFPGGAGHGASLYGNQLSFCLYTGFRATFQRLGHYHLCHFGRRLCCIPFSR